MKTQKLTAMAILLALVIILQLFATFIPTKPFAITLTLIPIVVGGALYGKKSGALLGFAFTGVVLITYIIGASQGGHMLWESAPVLTAVITLLRGTLAGFVSALVYSVFKSKNSYLAGVLSAITCPIVNTGIFCLSMIFVFRETLNIWSKGGDAIYYLIFGMVGINFLIELSINVILSPAIVRIIGVGKKRK